jgi:hypothetical protein
MAMAASARGESSSAIDRSADGSPIREASSAPRRHSGSLATEDELDSFNSSADRQRGMYVSAADVSVHPYAHLFVFQYDIVSRAMLSNILPAGLASAPVLCRI